LLVNPTGFYSPFLFLPLWSNKPSLPQTNYNSFLLIHRELRFIIFSLLVSLSPHPMLCFLCLTMVTSYFFFFVFWLGFISLVPENSISLCVGCPQEICCFVPKVNGVRPDVWQNVWTTEERQRLSSCFVYMIFFIFQGNIPIQTVL